MNPLDDKEGVFDIVVAWDKIGCVITLFSWYLCRR